MPTPTDTWITIVEADIQASQNNAEFQALITTALASGQSDPTTVLIPDVTEEVRGYVRRRNTLGPVGTLPQELKNAAIDIIIYRIALRISDSDTAKAWKGANDLAIEKLDKVAEGKIYVSAPLTPTTDVTSAPGPSFERPHSEGFGYNKERGL